MRVVATIACMASAAQSATLNCAVPGLTVTADDLELAVTTCHMAERGITDLANCNVVVPLPLAITVTAELPDQCLGIFDCHTGAVQVLVPDIMADRITQASPLRALSPEALFGSVITHEMTHAAYAQVPCPFGDCLATAEYAAYAMQIWTLAPADRARVTSALIYDAPVPRADITAVLLLMAPERFTQKAWLHLSQRPDPCGYMGAVMQGDIHFDRERP